MLGLKIKVNLKIKPPAECTPDELSSFQKLVIEGGEVTAYGLRQRIEQAERLVFVNENECLAVGAIKNPNEGYKFGVFTKAGIAEKSSEYTYELGWLYVISTARGKGLGHSLMQAVIEFLGASSCYATTRENNDYMRHLFSQYNFNKLGSAYMSENGYSLVLYAKEP